MSQMLISLCNWFAALMVVAQPFIQMAILWFGWQMGIGWLAWSTARFYSNNCATPGFSGFISSLSTMGSPICLGAWFSHAAFVVAYITAFVVAVLVVVLWLWNRIVQDRGVKRLQIEIAHLKAQIQKKPPMIFQKKDLQSGVGELDEVQL